MKELIEQIKNGQAVVLPTETVYGIFAKAMDENAVDNVYQLKQRPRDKAMNLNIASYQDILDYSQGQPAYLEKLVNAFLPGPLTIILKANQKVPAWINSGKTTVGFRMPNHPVTCQIIKETGPLIGPSANISGDDSGKTFKAIMKAFNYQVDGYSDDAALTGQDSTIIDISGLKAKILRQGSITKEELLDVVPELEF
ncbi:L-threonylcarbamoyladenylate synthase [Streptococcus parauberis]|uniref:L-threonylcarbamoyladenylate synthase n=1 Tax=Streptococcus parauberis TaxID=1348 RepID=UPI0002BAB1CE|nr:L-threonylcarbamoyladenylate synthase [Streptococcus parauberis]EMF49808.1 YrdC/Sua5 family protein, required for threonylcarbamoyladenosine (t(6)A) formation in tRNA [Streptococcus parauberis KRS-02109]PIA85149.1 Threonylcarbamoyl-AMP synthase [Streptococcus parauberis]UWM87909.1 L-threonylcarbamoyladenylate synthase [Streptococcus parauberis]UWM89881.1 L-threonylcarbamoyladenylate synthase [Streptococcus parauberis]WEM60485.1 L-threonylcarbamoyladenylate synthase [Streptococcus parauberis